jgi:hypothetical protein
MECWITSRIPGNDIGRFLQRAFFLKHSSEASSHRLFVAVEAVEGIEEFQDLATLQISAWN